MPLIQSRKYPDNEQFIDAGAWKVMQEKGLARRFRVVDDNDLRETVIPAPKSIVEFGNEEVSSPADDTVEKIPEMARQDIKDELDKLGVEYNTRATTDKLYGLYIENNK